MAVRDLLNILSWQRGAGTKSEASFVYQHIATIPGIKVDEYGNYHLQIGDDPVILWSSHTDTVTKNEGRQNVKWIAKDMLGLHNGKPGQCLGADDGAGLWLMMELIAAGKEGYYVFHRDEEIGGMGSSWLSKNAHYFPPTIRAAIAMDRAGTRDVITHQYMSRCCSNEFALSLAAQLDGDFQPDDTGVFTDTANYTDLIGECTNLSVGYEHNHGPREILDVAHLKRLRQSLIDLDVSKLEFKREPGEQDPNDYYSHYAGNNYAHAYGGGHGFPDSFPFDVDDDDDVYSARYGASGTPLSKRYDFGDAVKDYPGIAARLLEELGIEFDEFRAHVFAFTGNLLPEGGSEG